MIVNGYEIEPKGALIAADLRDANLEDADLTSALLIGAYLSHANLKGANLRGIEAMSADFTYANLDGSDLTNADLKEAAFPNAHFINADLTNADLRECNLKEADFSGANLSGANLTNANLTGAMLENAIITKEQLDSCYNPKMDTENENISQIMQVGMEAIQKRIDEVQRSIGETMKRECEHQLECFKSTVEQYTYSVLTNTLKKNIEDSVRSELRCMASAISPMMVCPGDRSGDRKYSHNWVMDEGTYSALTGETWKFIRCKNCKTCFHLCVKPGECCGDNELIKE